MSSTVSPTFLIPGATRSGTTLLFYYLRQHPDIFMPEKKELRFFDQDANYNRGLDYYESQFDEWNGETAIGEASPPYLTTRVTLSEDGSLQWTPENDIPARIQRAYPDIKLVFTLRNPVTRAYSMYWKNLRQTREDADSFREAIEAELHGRRTPTDGQSWVYQNRYGTHLERWFDLFSEENIMILVFERWIEQPEQALDRICDFLGVSPRERWAETIETKNSALVPRSRLLNELLHDYVEHTRFWRYYKFLNLKSDYPNMDPETRSFLFDVFESEIKDLESLTGLGLDIWFEG